MATHFLSVIEPMLRDGVRYSDLSVEQIVRTGGIARSTFYEYFDDKWALLAAMADDVLSQLFEAGRVWWQLADTGTKADLRAAMAPAFAEYQRHKPVLTAVNEATAHDKAIGAYQEMLLDGVIADLKKHIRAGQRKGLAAAGLDADRTAKWLVMMLDRGMNTLVSDANERENAKLLDSAVDIIWRTLYAGCRPET